MGSPARTMSEFYRKLAGVRDKLKVWNREVFGHIGTRVTELEKIMHTKEVEYDMERTVMSKIACHEARATYMQHLAIECDF